MEITEFKIVRKGVGYVLQITVNGIIKFYSARDFDNEKQARKWLEEHGLMEVEK